jgi:hypothetical protein
MAIILGQTSTVQDFTVQKFGLTSRSRLGPSLTLGAQHFMTKEEGNATPILCVVCPNSTAVGDPDHVTKSEQQDA